MFKSQTYGDVELAQIPEKLKDWYEKGYLVKSAIISCILAWKGKDDEEECAVILPDLVLQKQKK